MQSRQNIFKSFPYVFVRRKQWEQTAFSEKLLHTARQKRISGHLSGCRDTSMCGIVFSRDRALQLSALLDSYHALIKNPVPLYLMYSCSTKAHADSYSELVKTRYPHLVDICNETNFRDDLIAVLERITSERVFFLVDDMMFTRQFDIRAFDSYDPDIYVASLRLGNQLRSCYAQCAPQPLPAFAPRADNENNLLKWRWADGVHDWGYPLSLDGHIFARAEILEITRRCRFKAPNSYERVLQEYRKYFASRLGVCFERSVTVNLPVNKVQREYDNRSGAISADDLLTHWQAGRRIQWQRYTNLENESVQQECELHLA